MGGEISKANNFALSNLHHFKDSANSKCSAYGLRGAHLRLGIRLLCARRQAAKSSLPTKLLAN
jgi:hypothetical protein